MLVKGAAKAERKPEEVQDHPGRYCIGTRHARAGLPRGFCRGAGKDIGCPSMTCLTRTFVTTDTVPGMPEGDVEAA